MVDLNNVVIGGVSHQSHSKSGGKLLKNISQFYEDDEEHDHNILGGEELMDDDRDDMEDEDDDIFTYSRAQHKKGS